MKPGIKQISELTGFSLATVSNALNGKKNVNKETAERILSVASEIGYIAKKEIRKIRLVSFRNNKISANNAFFYQPLLDGVAKYCSDHNYELVVCSHDQSPQNKSQLLEDLLGDPLSGYIFFGKELTDDDLSLIKRSGSPFVMLDRWQSDMSFSAVLIDNYDSGKTVGQYLLQKGHTKIGFLGGAHNSQITAARKRGLEKACKTEGYPVDEHYVIRLRSTTEDAYLDMKQYLASDPVLPTAYFASNDMVALGAMRALQEAGYEIPKDISIIGFDNLPHSDICSPRLTTVAVPRRRMGILAAQILIEEASDPEVPHLRTEFCTTLIERESVRSLNE